MTKRSIILALAIGTGVSTTAYSQTAYYAANAQPSIIPWSDGLFSIDFTEAKLGLNFVEPILFGCDDDSCTANQINFSVHASGAARKGQRDLTGNFDFVPGFDIGGGVAYISRPGAKSHNVIFLRATYTTQQRDIIVRDVGAGTTSIDDESQRSFVLAAGFNHAISNTTVVGVSLEGRRELSTPGAQSSQEFCTPGTSAGGFRVLVCSDRFVGPLPNLWAAQARSDVNLAVANLGGQDTSARLSLIGAGSIDFIETANSAVNFALGPGISMPAYPGQPVAILVFGIRDAFEVNDNPALDSSNYFKDHFLIRLSFSIPFEVLTGNP